MELILLRDVFALSCLFSLVAPLGQRASDINEIIRDHTEPEPAFLLLAFAFCAFGGAIGNANAFDALHFGRLLIFVGVEGSIGCHQVWRASELSLMGFDGWN